MQSFEWSPRTRVIFGLGRFGSVHRFVKGFGKRAFIVTSASFQPGGVRAFVLQALTQQLRSIGVEVDVFSGVEANPSVATVDLAATRARAFEPRYVIALGGGSAMDAAKAVALLQSNEGSIYDYVYKGPGKPMTRFNHALPVVCIPTVAATSSETDFYAVVTHGPTRRKLTVFGDAIYPALSVIDPELTYTVSPKQTVDGAFDMITHVMETYLSTKEPAHFQDRMSESFVETVVRMLPRALSDPRDAEARSNLSWCAAFALSGTFSGREGGWPVHALEHGLSAYTDVAHGRGLAMLLPRLMAFNALEAPAKILEFNRRVFGVTETKDPLRALEDGLVRYMKEVGAWCSFASEGLAATPEVLSGIIDHAFEVSAITKRGEAPYLENIRPLLRVDAEKILAACVRGSLC